MSTIQDFSETGRDVIEQHPNKVGGVPLFKGTRVPVKNLFDYLSEGYDLAEFLDDHPSVSEDQARFVMINYSASAFD